MNNIDHTRLARLRPEKLDDVAVKEQIFLIQQTCDDVDPEIIALVFHECDYNMQQTIARLRARDYEDGGWQKAKPNNKKKNHSNNNHNVGDQIINGITSSDNERSLSQRTSPISSIRDTHRRNDHYQYSSSMRTNNTGRRGNDSNRNHFLSPHTRYSSNTNPINKSIPLPKQSTSSQSIPSEPSSSSLPKQSNEEIPQRTSPSIDEYEFVDGIPQSLSFDNSQKKIPLQQSSEKRRIVPTIPQKPVSMHPTIQFSTEPIDIQFGDVQWKDSVARAVTPSDDTSVSTTFNKHEQNMSSIVNAQDHESNQDAQDNLSSNYIGHSGTNETDIQFLETTNQLSSSSINDNTISNNLSIVPTEGTSHLSDHLTSTSSPVATQSSSQLQAPIQIPITRLPPTSTPRASEYTSPTSQFIPNNPQQNNATTTASAFTPFNNLGNYPSIPREYPQTTATATWNPQSSNYKTNPKAPALPIGTYSQQTSYQIPPQQQQQQQQIFVGPYPYPTLSPTVVQVFAPLDHWSTTGFSAPLESYQYPTTNYIPTYPNQPQYHPPTKYDQHSYDKEFFAHYGQTSAPNNDLSYPQQQSSTSSQPTKEMHIASKLSPTAATFSQGAPLTASPSSTALYLNPVAFSIPNYMPTVSGSTYQDQILSHSSINNRDNRNGASYGNANNRNNYYHHGQQQQQQRTHNNNASNSTWHLQQ
ncbi:unnamed protein product [Adineta steineri]|uniref:Uncharacterized protein n=1 Tax=Adineta steineri TaxID=433720 RepID=A0A813QSX0_9BILA|nr:unnamed protein product [Adineta steineri]CAF1088518.1 unnamed protein product [Adineta steineri]